MWLRLTWNFLAFFGSGEFGYLQRVWLLGGAVDKNPLMVINILHDINLLHAFQDKSNNECRDDNTNTLQCLTFGNITLSFLIYGVGGYDF